MSTDWSELRAELFARENLFVELIQRSRAQDFPNPYETAATDLFVEKAQQHLTRRAGFHVVGAFVSGGVGIIVIALAWYYANYHTIGAFLSEIGETKTTLDTFIFLMWAFRTAVLGGLALAFVYFAVALCRAFLHEASTLYGRRHSLRFGRLIIYLQYAKANERVTINVEELEKAFGWNLVASSAFQDINPGKMTDSVFGRIFNFFDHVVEKFLSRPK